MKLPRGYLSWSQMDLFQKNPEEYKRVYILGEERNISNPYLDFGKLLADGLEKNIELDFELENLKLLLPKYKIAEKKIEVKMNGIKLLGYIDSFNPKTKAIYEYKTGKSRWTQDRADKHGQLDFYSVLIYVKYKVIPKIELVWVETEQNRIIRPTGKIQTFKVKKDLKDVLKMMSKIQKVAKKISVMYEKI